MKHGMKGVIETWLIVAIMIIITAAILISHWDAIVVVASKSNPFDFTPTGLVLGGREKWGK